MESPDIIILSNTKDIHHYGLTTRAINSLRASEKFNFNEIIVESNSNYLDKGFVYHNSHVITPNEHFNYNRFLNFGLKHSKSEWVIVSNNDVIFTQNWYTNLMKFVEKNPKYLSLSPYEPNWHKAKNMDNTIEYYEGYRTSYEITGWCLIINKQVISQCSLFDERFKFWYQDDDYAKTLECSNIPHALVTSSRVYHDISKSYDILTPDQLHEMTNQQYKVFSDKWIKTTQ